MYCFATKFTTEGAKEAEPRACLETQIGLLLKMRLRFAGSKGRAG